MSKVGQQVGGFRLVRELGSGGFGSVYLGEDSSGRQAAVKVLHPHLAKDPQVRRYFLQEFSSARQVQGFCVAEILDADPQAAEPWLASEYVDGPTLSAEVRDNGPRAGGELQRLAVQTITALVAIHAAGVVHRDLKPANILLARDGPRVIDFGIARALDADTHSATQIGTIGYMAPEQIEGTTLGPAADLFAWGAVIIYAASGKEAFPGPTQAARMHRVLTQPPETGGLTEPLLSIVLACMDKDPARRLTARQVLDMLLTGSRTPASAPAPPGPHHLSASAPPRASVPPTPDPTATPAPLPEEPDPARKVVPPTHARWPGFAVAGAAAVLLLSITVLPWAQRGDTSLTLWQWMGSGARWGALLVAVTAGVLGLLGGVLRRGGLAASAVVPATLGLGALVHIVFMTPTYDPQTSGGYVALLATVGIIGIGIVAAAPGTDPPIFPRLRRGPTVRWAGFVVAGAAVLLLVSLLASSWEVHEILAVAAIGEWDYRGFGPVPPPGVVMLWFIVAAGTFGLAGGTRRQARLTAAAAAPAAAGATIALLILANPDHSAFRDTGSVAVVVLLLTTAVSLAALRPARPR